MGLVEKECAHCGRLFSPENAKNKCCSTACSEARITKQKKEYGERRLKKVRNTTPDAGPFICKWCGDEFYAKYKNMRRSYCSAVCAKKAAYERISFYQRIKKEITRIKCKNGTYRDPISLKRLYSRDGGVCQICHKKIKWGIKSSDPMAATRDHIVPLSFGGEHSWENVRLSHFSCNRIRGNSGSAQTLLFG